MPFNTGGVEPLSKQDLTSQDTTQTVSPAHLRLFKPARQSPKQPSTLSAPSSGTSAIDYHANVNAVAQQARDQQLKQKQAAVKAELELDRLKGLLQREQALQVLACAALRHVVCLLHPANTDCHA